MEIEEDLSLSNSRTNESPSKTNYSKTKKKLFGNFFVEKIMGSLYNFVHPFPTEYPLFSDSPIILLGQSFQYTPKKNYIQDQFSNDKQFVSNESSNNPLFSFPGMLEAFYSLIWFSYRKDYPPLEPSHFTTDIGWGCMLRTGQMLVAKALSVHLCGYDWKINEKEKTAPFSYYRQILRWFSDSPSPSFPYSIHNFVKQSHLIDLKQYGKDYASITTKNKVGEYFTPSRICQIIKQAVEQHSPNGLCVYIAENGVIYQDQVRVICTSPSSPQFTQKMKPERLSMGWTKINANFMQLSNSNYFNMVELIEEPNSTEENEQVDEEKIPVTWRSLMILVPLRLGVENLNKTYIPFLKNILQLRQCIGIVGGKPKQSLYFAGYQDDDLIYLDPHIVRTSFRPEDKFSDDQFHCAIPLKMSFLNMDPSLVLGFYCRDEKEFLYLCEFLKGLSTTPVITIEEKTPSEATKESKESEGSEVDDFSFL